MYTAEVLTLFVEDALFCFELFDFNIVKFHRPFSVLVILISVCLMTRVLKLIFNCPIILEVINNMNACVEKLYASLGYTEQVNNAFRALIA